MQLCNHTKMQFRLQVMTIKWDYLFLTEGIHRYPGQSKALAVSGTKCSVKHSQQKH